MARERKQIAPEHKAWLDQYLKSKDWPDELTTAQHKQLRAAYRKMKENEAKAYVVGGVIDRVKALGNVYEGKFNGSYSELADVLADVVVNLGYQQPLYPEREQYQRQKAIAAEKRAEDAVKSREKYDATKEKLVQKAIDAEKLWHSLPEAKAVLVGMFYFYDAEGKKRASIHDCQAKVVSTTAKTSKVVIKIESSFGSEDAYVQKQIRNIQLIKEGFVYEDVSKTKYRDDVVVFESAELYKDYQAANTSALNGLKQALNGFAVLGLDETATQADIKAAYKKLAAKHHPDKGGDGERMAEINKAYKALVGVAGA